MKLEIRNLKKSFGQQVVLDNISLVLEKVHTLALIGPSGGGKSTLLRVIAGLERPNQGEVWLNDAEIIFEEKLLREHRRTVGTVFQSFNLFPHLTAFANVTLPLEKVHRHPPPKAKEMATEILERFQLMEHAHKQPAQLSGGQRQRIAIARAIAIRPKLLLFDEPTSALDPEMTGEVLDLIEELRQEGRDFVLVTHQMGFAHRVADQVAILSQGRIVECGPPAQVLGQPKQEVTRQFLSRILKY